MRSLLLFTITTLLTFGVHAQDLAPAPPVKKELKDAYKKWLDNDVSYMMSKDERLEFLGLKTEAEQDDFIEEYWRIRDTEKGASNERWERTIYADMFYDQLARLPDRPWPDLYPLGRAR